VSSLTLDD